jgi:hypothetical protein
VYFGIKRPHAEVGYKNIIIFSYKNHLGRFYGENGEEARALRTPRCLSARESWEGVRPRSARDPDAEAARHAGARHRNAVRCSG